MKNRSIVIILVVIGVFCIVSGSSMMVYNTINEQNKNKKQAEELIVKGHSVFKNEIESFNQARTDFYEKVISDMFIETVENYDEWIKVIDEYTATVDKVEEKSKNLKGACVTKFYSSLDVRNKCDSFVIAYETAVNYYTKDIKAFNESIIDFNKNLDNKLNEYELKYEFTDINDDGKYYGKD